ncbi:MAG: DNA repair protein RadC, partial [Pseudomonadota bacterium]
NALENEDLLELILSFDNFITDPQAMSKQLFSEFGSLGAILSSEPERLTRLEGITPRVNGLLKAIQLSIERVLHENVQQNPIIGSSQALLDFLSARLRHRQREELIAMYMDRQNRLIKVEGAQGTVSHVHLSPRDVATRALELFASSVIIAHNHPGGDKKPSREDVHITKQLDAALKALNIELYDHVIVCGKSCFSFKSEGLI